MDRQKTRLALRQVLFLQFKWRQIQVRLSIVVLVIKTAPQILSQEKLRP